MQHTSMPITPELQLPLPSRAVESGLRLAIVTESYPPEVNSVANSVARIVTGMRRRGHAVQLIRLRQACESTEPTRGEIDEILTSSVPTPMYRQLRMGLPATDRLTSAWTARRLDIVHIATEGPLGWSALRAAHALRLPVCSDFRTNFHAYGRFYGVGCLQRPIMSYLRRFHNRCHATMVPTQVLQRELAATGFQSLEVVARGVDTQLFAPGKRSTALRQQWGVHDSDPVVLHVGRLAPEKNLGVVLQAFEWILRVKPRARLIPVCLRSGDQRALAAQHGCRRAGAHVRIGLGCDHPQDRSSVCPHHPWRRRPDGLARRQREPACGSATARPGRWPIMATAQLPSGAPRVSSPRKP